MKILLDTHIFLWFIIGDSRLSVDIRDVIRDSDFDRMLICQALQNGLVIATVDPV